MVEQFVQQIIEFLGQYNIPSVLVIFLISMSPFSGAGIIAAAILQVSALNAFIFCSIGGILPMPFILLFSNKVFEKFRRSSFLGKTIIKIEERTKKKSSKIKKAGFWGLLLFVGVPFLPMGGPWMGALIAATIRLPFKRAFVALTGGILISNSLSLIFTHFLPGLIFN